MVPVGVPGRDVICIEDVCEKCNRHFLIPEEMDEHSQLCLG